MIYVSVAGGPGNITIDLTHAQTKEHIEVCTTGKNKMISTPGRRKVLPISSLFILVLLLQAGNPSNMQADFCYATLWTFANITIIIALAWFVAFFVARVSFPK